MVDRHLFVFLVTEAGLEICRYSEVLAQEVVVWHCMYLAF